MNVLLWVFQVLLALLIGMGSANQLFNYASISQLYAPYRELPQGFWVIYAVVALAAAMGLLLTPISPRITVVAALVLCIQSLVFAAIYAHLAGFAPSFAMWAVWTLGPAAVAAFIAYGRYALVR